MLPFWRMDRYWFLSNTFYGNWLPGDDRGFVSRVRDRRPDEAPSKVRHEHDQPGTQYDRGLAGLHQHAQGLLKCDPIRIALPHAIALLDQLKEGGRMVIPLGDRENQALTLVEHQGAGVRLTTLGDVRFVPLLGKHGFDG